MLEHGYRIWISCIVKYRCMKIYLNEPSTKKHCLSQQQPNETTKITAHMASSISLYIDSSLNAFFFFQVEILLEVMAQTWLRLSLISCHMYITTYRFHIQSNVPNTLYIQFVNDFIIHALFQFIRTSAFKRYTSKVWRQFWL